MANPGKVFRQEQLYYAFVDFENALNWVHRGVVKWASKKMMVEEWLMQTVMSVYIKENAVVKTNHGMSWKFEVKLLCIRSLC